MIDGIPHVRMNPPLRGRAELIRHISHSGKAPVPAIMYYQSENIFQFSKASIHSTTNVPHDRRKENFATHVDKYTWQ